MEKYSVRSVTEWVSAPASSSKPATGSWTSRTTFMRATRALAGSRRWLRLSRWARIRLDVLDMVSRPHRLHDEECGGSHHQIRDRRYNEDRVPAAGIALQPARGRHQERRCALGRV